MVGRTISHFKILSKLAEGGMGVLYEARDLKLPRRVALKFLSPELTRDPEVRKRFIVEAEAASSLDHPNICTIFEIGETDDGQTFIAMAYYRGLSVMEKLALGPIEIDEVLSVTRQVAAGLSRVHGGGIIHRDIKSANIFLTHDGPVKILDFGLAKISGATRLTRSGMTVGTASYMSPEQARGDRVDHRTDIWSLGVLIYEMTARTLPFGDGPDASVIYSIVNEDAVPVSFFRSDVPASLEAIIERCLAKNPDRRYPDIDSLIVDLENLEREKAAGEVTIARPSRIRRFGRKVRGFLRPR